MQRILFVPSARPKRPETSTQVAGTGGVGAHILCTSLDTAMRLMSACPRFQAHRSFGGGGREMHVARESASDDAGVVRRWLSTSSEEHIAALVYDRTSLLCFCEDDGSIAIDGTRSLGGRSISKLTPPRSLAEVFGVVWDIYNGGSS